MLEIRLSFVKRAENFIIAHPNSISAAQTMTQDAGNASQRLQKCFRQREAPARQELLAHVQR